MNLRHKVGQETEVKAAQWFLSQKKSKLIAKNYRCRSGEIDLIFEEVLPDSQSIELVFVEVRMRSKQGWLTGPESLDQKKQQRLKRTANDFLFRYRGFARTLRFDLLFWNGERWSHLSHLWLD